MKRTKIMAVAGMHRSATSAVAKGLHLAGFPMAPTEHDMIPAMPSNEFGHWEDRRLVHVNDGILYDLRSAWNNPPDQGEVMQRLPEFLPRIREYIMWRSTFHKGQWGLKDPRLVLLWQLWDAGFKSFEDVECIAVCPWRDPKTIAQSLVDRDGMDYDRALQLTHHYHELQSRIR